MAVLKRIAPASAFKVGLVSYAVLGLIAGVFCSLIALAGVSFAPHAHMPFAPAIGLFAVIVCPIVYGAIGGILTAISALLYNLAASWVGGVEVELN
jgi:MFS superfamily sulfate permease-like transporter